MADDREPVDCAACGAKDLKHFFLCDETEGAWCPACFGHTPCGRDEHGEGCPTQVFEDVDRAPDERHGDDGRDWSEGPNG